MGRLDGRFRAADCSKQTVLVAMGDPAPPPPHQPASNAFRHLIATGLLLPLLAACGDSAGAGGATSSVRDSAGVTIVESVGPAWEEGEEWRLSATPLLEIGATDGAPEYLFSRVVSAIRLGDGSIAVANEGSQEIRFYDASGAHLRSTGGSGSGPGQFQAIQWMNRFRGDSLVAYDQRSARATVMTSTGEFGRTLSSPRHESGGTANLLAVLADGTLIGGVNVPLAAEDLSSGMRSTPATYYRISPTDGELLDSIATLPGRESYLQIGEASIIVMAPLMGPAPHVTAVDDAIFLGFGQAFEIRRHAPDGVLQRLIRRVGEPQPLTEAELASLREERLSDIEPEEMRQQMSQVLESVPQPVARPAFAGLLVDRIGNLWVEESNLTGEPNRWSVFDGEGALLGSIDLPEGFDPLEVGEDYVLGVERDQLDVERVRMFGLEKP